MAKNFKDLTEREIVALAIALEEEDGRIYGDFIDGLRDTYPASAKMFEEMQAEESEHRASLIEIYRQRFGDHIPLIRRQDVKGFVHRSPIWLVKNLGVDRVRKLAASMELETRLFYDRAEAERAHVSAAEELEHKHLPDEVREQEETAQRRLFVLQVIQPGLAGLM